MTVTISMATEIDRPRIRAFIEKVGASFNKAQDQIIQYLIAKDSEAELIAVLGILIEDENLVLRHLIIDPKKCDMAQLLQIIEHAVAYGASNKLQRILLLTPAPAELFEPIGFCEMEDALIEESLQKSFPDLEELPASAKLLVRHLNG